MTAHTDNLVPLPPESGKAGTALVSVQPQGKFQSELKEQWMEVMDVWNTQQPAIVVHVEGVPLLTVTFAKEETGM